MKQQELILNEEERPLSVNPKKFLTWLFMVSITMMFAALTSAYLVRMAEGNWLDFKLPSVMWTTTILIVVSSITMQWSYSAAKKDNFAAVRIGLFITFVLGIAFLIGQFYAWKALVMDNVYFAGKYSNPSGSFVYVFTGLHGFHIVTGVIFLMITLISAYKLKIHSKNLTLIGMCSTYWHFLGGLWVYLFLFLLYNR